MWQVNPVIDFELSFRNRRLALNVLNVEKNKCGLIFLIPAIGSLDSFNCLFQPAWKKITLGGNGAR